jgi:hypothetical protein
LVPDNLIREFEGKLVSNSANAMSSLDVRMRFVEDKGVRHVPPHSTHEVEITLHASATAQHRTVIFHLPGN